MKSIVISLPLICWLAAGCNNNEPPPGGTNEAPPPAMQSDTPPSENRMPATDEGMSSSQGAMEVLSAKAQIMPTEGQTTGGTITLQGTNGAVSVTGEITGLTPGEHGFHVHANGDCSAPDASSAGGHFAPQGHPHGPPTAPPAQRHAGDLGNITADESGVAEVNLPSTTLALSGPESVIGKAIIVHADQDDFISQPSGNAGARVGCGVIKSVSAAPPAGSL